MLIEKAGGWRGTERAEWRTRGGRERRAVAVEREKSDTGEMVREIVGEEGEERTIRMI